jgi:hypothetical protein
MSRQSDRIVAVLLLALVAGCGGGSTLSSDGGGTDASVGGVRPSGMVSTPSMHIPSAPGACAPAPAVNCMVPSGGGSCALDSDCTAGLDGRCAFVNNAGCACGYDACATDADCGVGTACFCRPEYSGVGVAFAPTRCLPSNCRTDADCTSGYCSPSEDASIASGCGGRPLGNYCHTSSDECGVDTDCLGGGTCLYAPEVGHWICAPSAFCAG